MIDESNNKTQGREKQRIKAGVATIPSKLGWALRCFHKEEKALHIVAIGPVAIAKALKSVCVANGYLAPDGEVFDIFPRFAAVEEATADGGEMKAVVLELRVRSL